MKCIPLGDNDTEGPKYVSLLNNSSQSHPELTGNKTNHGKSNQGVFTDQQAHSGPLGPPAGQTNFDNLHSPLLLQNFSGNCQTQTKGETERSEEVEQEAKTLAEARNDNWLMHCGVDTVLFGA